MERRSQRPSEVVHSKPQPAAARQSAGPGGTPFPPNCRQGEAQAALWPWTPSSRQARLYGPAPAPDGQRSAQSESLRCWM